MEEYIYSKTKENHKKKIIVFIIMAAIAVVLVLQYEQILSIFGGSLSQEGCLGALSLWCGNCFRANDYSSGYWDVEGEALEGRLAECANEHFGAQWSPGQDCTDDIVDDCMYFIYYQQ